MQNPSDPRHARELYALALEIAETEQVSMGAALSKARRLLPELLKAAQQQNQTAAQNRPEQPPTA